MASFNQILLMGNLTRDPTLKHLPSGSSLCEFGLACNRKYRTAQGEDREDVLFVDCVAYGKTSELVNQYFTKGKPIFIQGRLAYSSWEDKNGGGKRSKLTVTVDHFQFIGGKDGEQSRGGSDDQGDDMPGSTEVPPPQRRQAPPPRSGPTSRPPPSRTQNPAGESQSPFGEKQGFDSEELPF